MFALFVLWCAVWCRLLMVLICYFISLFFLCCFSFFYPCRSYNFKKRCLSLIHSSDSAKICSCAMFILLFMIRLLGLTHTHTQQTQIVNISWMVNQVFVSSLFVIQFLNCVCYNFPHAAVWKESIVTVHLLIVLINQSQHPYMPYWSQETIPAHHWLISMWFLMWIIAFVFENISFANVVQMRSSITHFFLSYAKKWDVRM